MGRTRGGESEQCRYPASMAGKKCCERATRRASGRGSKPGPYNADREVLLLGRVPMQCGD